MFTFGLAARPQVTSLKVLHVVTACKTDATVIKLFSINKTILQGFSL